MKGEGAPPPSVSCLLSSVSSASPVSSLRSAFTLAELMIVVAIIALLVGILLPAVGQVRNRAKAVASSAVLSAIGTGLETSRADGNLGGEYPPSYSDADPSITGSLPHRGQVADPYQTGGGMSFGIEQMPGAGLLVWGLAGADQLGTPGFKQFRTGSQTWSQDTDRSPEQATDPTASGAYALDSSDRPIHPRSGPYVDLSKVQITQYENNPGGHGFVIDAETNAHGGGKTYRGYPLFLDTFGSPILYWKADPAGNRIVDRNRNQYTGADRGIYHWEDNWALLDDTRAGSVAGIEPLRLREGDETRDINSILHWDEDWDPDKYDSNPATDDKDPPPDKTFANFIMNLKITAKPTPLRADSYLLLSPGYDGEYGTADDVTNFK